MVGNGSRKFFCFNVSAGSPGAFWIRESPTGSTKWIVMFEGGGWCYEEADCVARAASDLGSSDLIGSSVYVGGIMSGNRFGEGVKS